MNEIPNELKLNSKELNQILPSYLIEEIENNQNHNSENQINNRGNENNVILIFLYNFIFIVQ